jgi:hypothetical protein
VWDWGINDHDPGRAPARRGGVPVL